MNNRALADIVIRARCNMVYLFAVAVAGVVFAIGYLVGSERGYRQAHTKIVEAQIYRSSLGRSNFATNELRLVDDTRQNENST